MTSLPAGRDARKSLGAFYSPNDLVQPLVRWAVRRPVDSVLDPACGDGIFLELAARRLQELGASRHSVAGLVHGLDVNPQAVQTTRDLIETILGNQVVDLRVMSFFAMDPPGTLFGEPGFDAVVGNPPYVRYQEFSGNLRRQALRRASQSDVKLSSLTSSWAPFVVHAVSFLKRGGRLALILPAELIHASYAAPIRSYLRASFAEIDVVSFRQAVFPGTQEEVVLVLASGKGETHDRLGLVELDSAADLHHLDERRKRAESFPIGVEPEKWAPGYTTSGSVAILEKLRVARVLVPLNTLGKAGIGFVSGANGFFVLTPEETSRWSLPAESLQPALIRAAQVRHLILAERDLNKMREGNERHLLWRPEARLTDSERAYVRYGESQGVHERYKCRAREPWYRVPGIVVPDAILTYMSNMYPRLCLNEARSTVANNLLAVMLGGVPSHLRLPFVVAFHNSATLLSCERTGRNYGGGVLKLEPREADRVLVPAVEIVGAYAARLRRLAGPLNHSIAKREQDQLDETIAEVDVTILGSIGLSRDEIRQLRRDWRNFMDRRLHRTRGRPLHRSLTAQAEARCLGR